jgi:predicted nucleotidyltransferase
VRTLNEVDLSNEDRRAVESADRVLKERFPVERVILCGSKARGEDDPESDIDLPVLTSRPISWEEWKAMIHSLFNVEMAHDVVISPLIATVSDWEDGPFSVMPIDQEVAQDGVAA